MMTFLELLLRVVVIYLFTGYLLLVVVRVHLILIHDVQKIVKKMKIIVRIRYRL